MTKIKIITDSTADLSEELLKKHNIESLPLHINFGEESYLDGLEINTETLFRKIKEGDVFPTTSQVTPQSFYDLYKKYLDEGCKIISIHISSKLSGTVQSAFLGKNMTESDDIFIIDSENITGGLGMLVLKASAMAERGAEAEDIVREIEKIKHLVKSSLVFESLEHLVKGGRLSKAAGMVVTVLGIRLILEVKDGELVVRSKVRGTKKAVKEVISELEKGINKEETVLLMNCFGDEIYLHLKEYLDEKGINYIEAQVGCTVGVHAGPGVAAIFYIAEIDN